MDIERVVVRFMADATSYNRVMDGVDARLRNFARNASGLASFIVSPIAAATESLVALSRVVVDSGRYAVHTAMQYEQLGIQLEVIAKDADKGKQMLEDMFQVAINTPFQVKEVAAAGKELAAFGFSVEEIVPLVKQLGDVSAGTGTPMHRLILAFGQAKIAGRLMGQEMRQFVNANVPMIEHLAAVLGKPTMQIKKMIENGQIGFDIVQQAMNRMTGEGGIFGGMMERMNKTAIGQWRSFIESLEIGLYKVGKVFFEVFDLQDTFRSWKEWAMDTSQDAGGLKTMFEGIRDALHGIRNIARFAWEGFSRIATSIVEIVKAVYEWATVNKNLLITLGLILSVTTAIRLVVWSLTVAFGVLRTVLIAIRALLAINAVISAWGGIVAAAAALFGWMTLILPVLGAVIYAFTQLDQTGGFFEGFGKSFLEGLNQISETVGKVFKGISNAVKSGDMGLAFDIAFKGIQYSFKVLMLSLEAEWKRFKMNIAGVGGAGDTWKAGLAIGMNAVEREIKRLVLSPADFAAFEKEYAAAEKKILLQHSKAMEGRDSRIDSEIKAIMDRAEPMKKELSDLIMKAQVAAERAEIASHMPEIKKLQQELAGIIHGRFLEDVASQGLFSSIRKYSSAIIGGQFIPGMDHFVSDPLNPKHTQENLLATNKAYQLFSKIQELSKGTVMGIPMSGLFSGDKIGFNTSAVQYSLSGEAKSLAEKVQQQYMRGVGEETHKYDYFMKNMGLIDQARTGMTPDYKAAFDAAGPISKMFLQAGASKNSALSADEADYGLLNEFDKIKKYVGDRMSTGPRAMAFGSSEAQDTINRAVTQQVPVLDQIRTIMEAAKDMQRQQLEYQKQAVDALRELSGSKPPAAPMPREAGFAVDKP